MTAAASTASEHATAVAPLGDGAWAAACDPAWWVIGKPNGGDLAAIVRRAMSAVLGDALDLRIHFRAPCAAAAVGAPAPVLVEFRSTTAAGGFIEKDGRIRSGDGVPLAHSRRLALLTPPGDGRP